MNKPGNETESIDERTEDTELFRSDSAARSSHLRLVIAGDGIYATYPLPSSGQLTIGRSEKADVCIEDPLISRKHARLHLGAKIVVEDLGSANGIRVRDTPLGSMESIEIVPGDSIDLGTTTIILQRGSATRRPRRVLSHSSFEARVEDECTRSSHSRASFAVLRVHVATSAPASDVQEILSVQLRSVDVLAMYGPNEYELLLVETTPERARDVASRIVAKLDEVGGSVRVGQGCYPTDGTAPEEILARACDAVRVREEGERGRPAVVRDGAMQHIQRLVKRIAVGTISVIILGETGVGKEVLAESIHRESPRAKRPFLGLNCASLPEGLLSSELFGHERGAFTGAVAAKPGLLETAQGGTVFFDEVGELPPSIQVKLLRVIEERQVYRVGSLKPHRIDVRFLAATNRDLEAEVAMGTFREDLYFRLNGISILIPPLRERLSELDGLVAAFIDHGCKQANRASRPTLSAEGMELFRRYAWPGNIRELRNVLERAVLLCAGNTITLEHLPVEKMQGTLLSRRTPRSAPPSFAGGAPPDLRMPRAPAYPPRPSLGAYGGASDAWPPPSSGHAAPETMRPESLPHGEASPANTRGKPSVEERERILEALDHCAGNQTKAAKVLGISRRTLVARIEMYGLPRPRKSTSA